MEYLQKEGKAMAVRVLMERHVVQGRELELNALLRELRAKALKQPGYLSGETVVSADDPSLHLVISNWFTIKDWQGWERNPERQEFIEKINSLLETPPKTTVWLEQAGVAVAAL